MRAKQRIAHPNRESWFILFYGTLMISTNVRYLDQIAETLPNTVSISLPAITDAGIFKRLIQSMKGQAQVEQLAKAGISTAQACNFIGDSLSRLIFHYVPMTTIANIPRFFPTCEPLLYSHLLSKRPLEGAEGNTETLSPTTLLCAIVGLRPEQIDENTVVTSYGIDSLGGRQGRLHLEILFIGFFFSQLYVSVQS